MPLLLLLVIRALAKVRNRKGKFFVKGGRYRVRGSCPVGRRTDVSSLSQVIFFVLETRYDCDLIFKYHTRYRPVNNMSYPPQVSLITRIHPLAKLSLALMLSSWERQEDVAITQRGVAALAICGHQVIDLRSSGHRSKSIKAASTSTRTVKRRRAAYY